MSILKLKGSSSGYVELTAPATAGNNTITLPTTAGTVAVRDASNNVEVGTGTTIGSPSSNVFTVSTNGSERVRVSSAGSFGVGTATPRSLLDIGGSQAFNAGTYQSPTLSVSGYIAIKSASTDGTSRLTLIGDSDTGDGIIDWGGNGNFNLKFTNNGAERVRIDSSGRLLVGTTSYAGNGKLITAGNTGGNAGTFDICWAGSRPTAADTDIGYIRWYSADNSSSNYHYASIHASSDGTSSSGTDIPGRLVFSVTADGAASPTERFRISNNGYAYFQSTGQGGVFATTQSAGTSFETILAGHGATNGTWNSVNVSFKVFSNGNVQNTNGSFTAISDAKLKENIIDANSQWNDLKAIKIRNWNFKAETGHETHRQIGPIAQELEAICPGLVFETPDRDEEGNDLGTVTKGVNQSVLYMKAVKALQEAMERIETLEAQNADFSARLAALESA